VTDAAVVGRILREYRQDNIAPASVRRLSGSVSGARVGYQLALPDGGTVLVRAFRCDEPLPAYLQGCGTASVTDWLLGRTATLEWLASRGYPAPRVVATRTGDPVGVAGIWLTWATTYVPGRPLAPGGDGLGLLGEALGRLGVALPMTVVHGDAWPGNVIRTGEAQVTLIDWENGGLGLAVTDLGHCLLECHLDPGLSRMEPSAWLIQPDEARIAAVLAGYCRLRRLSSSERHLLPSGIRFATAFAGALHFEQALIDGVRGAGMDARLARLRNRLEVSQAVAELAARHLGEAPSRYAEPGSPVAGGTGA